MYDGIARRSQPLFDDIAYIYHVFRRILRAESFAFIVTVRASRMVTFRGMSVDYQYLRFINAFFRYGGRRFFQKFGDVKVYIMFVYDIYTVCVIHVIRTF